jgi:hypothetical protein
MFLIVRKIVRELRLVGGVPTRRRFLFGVYRWQGCGGSSCSMKLTALSLCAVIYDDKMCINCSIAILYRRQAIPHPNPSPNS